MRGLRTSFHTRDGIVRAVDGIDFHVDRGEIMGLVGESGCGKSVTSLSIMRLVAPPGTIEAGEILFDGQDLLKLPTDEMRKIRGNRISMIFQQPQSSLNPVWDVGAQIAEVLELHRHMNRKAARSRAIELLKMVGIPDPERRLKAYPHEMSGGMAQRVMIAMALACEPELLIADEPTTALDVTIQAQILDLMRDLREETGTAIILITHDLGVVAEMCDRVAVMYAGEIVEQTDTVSLFRDPLHPYTRGLIASIPLVGDVARRAGGHPGQRPQPDRPAEGCRFAPRCRSRVEQDVTLSTEAHPALLPHGPGTTSGAGCTTTRTATAAGLGHGPPVISSEDMASGGQRVSAERVPIQPGPEAAPSTPLVQVVDLVKHFPIRGGLLNRVVAHVQAVSGVSFEIRRGETLGLVGESGSGKTTVGRLLLRLIEPTSGTIMFDGTDITKLKGARLKPFRRRMQIIFQDPYASLDPRTPIGDSIGEGLRIHALGTPDGAAREGPPDDGPRRADAVPRPALPARVQRRPAPADRDRPGARRSSRTSSSATSPCPRSTCRSRPRC